MKTNDLGIEVVLEPGVVPRGTLDLRSLDAPAGAVPPPRRIEPDGRVFALAAVAAPAPKPADVATPAAAPGAGEDEAMVASRPPAEQVSGVRSPSARSRRQLGSGDAPIPPRPAAAALGSGRRAGREGTTPLEDDYETQAIAGGFVSALGTLVKLVTVLAGFTLATVVLYLYLNDLLPGTGHPATTVQRTDPPKPEVVRPTPPEPAKPDVAPPTTASVDTTTVAARPEPATSPEKSATREGLGDLAGGVSADLAKAEQPVPAPEVGGDIGAEESRPGELEKIESLRAEGARATKRGDYDAALKAFDELLALVPGDSDGLRRRALVLYLKGDLEAAEPAYVTAAAAAPDDPRPLNNLGLVRLARRSPDSAREAFETALEKDAAYPPALTNLASMEREKAPAKARALYDKALGRDAKYEVALYNRGTLALAMGDRDTARADLKLVADGLGEREYRAAAWYELGRLALEEGKAADAVAFDRAALEAKPGLSLARLHLGVALAAQGDLAQAERELLEAIKARPRDARAYRALGNVLVRQQERMREAKLAYEKALDLDDKDATTHYDYALCAERFGNFLFAIQEYEQVTKLDPKHWKALANLSRLYREAARNAGERDATLAGKNAAKALEFIDRALAVEPSNAELHLHRANVLATLHRDGESRLALTQFVKLAPTDPRVPAAKRALGVADEPPVAVPVPDAKKDGRSY